MDQGVPGQYSGTVRCPYRRVAATVGALCLLLSRLAAAETSWPRLHGPRGDNVSAETGLLQAWPEGGPTLLWTATGLGDGYASVSVAEGMICTAGDTDKANVVICLDLNGKPLWQFEHGAAWNSSVAGARCTPTIDRARVFHLNSHGSLVCLDAKTGQKRWERSLTAHFGGRCGGYSYAESLILDGDRLICSPGGETAMAALAAETGETVWKSASAGEAAGYATPILAECQGLRLLLTMSERSLIGVNANSGDLLFRFEHVNPQYVANCVTPVFQDGCVFISYGYGVGSVLLRVLVDGAKAAVEPVWRNEALDNRHGGVVLVNGFLYGASQQSSKGQWCCLEWTSGRLAYTAAGVGEGSLTVAEGMLYTLSERGKMGLVKATPDGHEVVSQFSLPPGVKGASWAHPVVCGGRLYIRHGDNLYAYDVKAK